MLFNPLPSDCHPFIHLSLTFGLITLSHSSPLNLGLAAGGCVQAVQRQARDVPSAADAIVPRRSELRRSEVHWSEDISGDWDSQSSEV